MAKQEDNKTSLINIPKLIEAYRSIWKWVLASVVIFVALGFMYAKKAEDQCEIAAQVLVSDEGSSAASSFGDIASMFGASSGSFGSNRSIEDEMVVIKAHSLLRETVEELGMNVTYRVKKNFIKWEDVYYNPPVRLIYDRNIADTLSVGLNFKLSFDESGKGDVVVKGRKNKVVYEAAEVTLPVSLETGYGVFTLVPGNSYPEGKDLHETISLVSYDGAALALNKLISVDLAEKKTDIMSLSYISTDARFGKSVLDSLVSNYNQLTINQKRNFSAKTLQFLENRIKILAAEVDSTQSQVEEFMGRRDLVNPETQAAMILTRTDKQEVELIKAEAEHELLTMAIEFLSNEANNTSMLPIMPSTESLTPLIEGYNELILNRLAIETSAKGDNVALKAMNTRICAVRDNLLTALNKSSETAKVKIDEMRRQFAKSKNKLETMPEIEREYTNILRQQTLKEQLYVYVLRQREETEMAIEGAHPRGVIIDMAYVTDAVLGLSPKVVLFLFLIIGLLVPAGYILLKWTISKYISIVDQAVDLSGSTVIAQIPAGSGDGADVVDDPESMRARRYRLLRGNLLSLENDKYIVAVTETADNHASVDVAVNLAISMANTGRRTVLVDADVFSPAVDKVLGLSTRSTIQSCIAGQELKADSLKPGREGTSLDVIACRADEQYGADLLASVEFARLVAQLSEKYEMVILRIPGLVDHYASVETVNELATVLLSTVTVGESRKDVVKNLATLDNHDGQSFLVEVK